MSLGTARRSLSKLMLKRAIDWLMTHRAQNIRTSGEIRPDQLEDRVRTYRAVVRAATDALSYLHAAAIASTASTGEHEDDEDAVLYLQTADDRLGGVESKGCGLVFCAKGRTLVDRVLSQTATVYVMHESPP